MDGRCRPLFAMDHPQNLGGNDICVFPAWQQCDGCVRVTPHRVREKQGTAASDPHVPLFSLAFVSEFRFHLV